MICIAISDKNIKNCLSIMDQAELVEIRLDLTGFSTEEIKQVFSHPTPAIATCRPLKGSDDQLEKLSAAIHAGAAYVDIEIEADKNHRESLIDMARKNDCKVIISYHNFEKTPGLKELYNIMDQCYTLGADVAKLATQCNSQADSARILSLYSNSKPLVALGMGEFGKITRIVSPFLGAEFTFSAMDDGEATASGQVGYSKMKGIIENLKKELN